MSEVYNIIYRTISIPESGVLAMAPDQTRSVYYKVATGLLLTLLAFLATAVSIHLVTKNNVSILQLKKVINS